MSEETRAKAQEALALVEEVTATTLPEPIEANAIVTLADADEPLSAEIKTRMAEKQEWTFIKP